MSATPGEMPDTRPKEFTDAIPGSELDQVPPGVELVAAAEMPAQTAETPPIGEGNGLIVTDFTAKPTSV